MFKKAIAFTFIILFIQGCAYWVRYDGPYKGRVVDEETGKPIEGVVVLGVWNTVMNTPAGETHHFSDATETVTDEKGEFEIKGKGLRILSNLDLINVLIFKTGYKYWDVPWVALKEDIILRDRIKWENDRAIIPLRKLTMAERKAQLSPSPPSEAYKKDIKMILNEINKDRAERGLGAINVGR
jgi:hypothetical protein